MAVAVGFLPGFVDALPLASGTTLTESEYGFSVDGNGGTLVGAFHSAFPMAYTVVTTKWDFYYHTIPPTAITFCGGSFNVSLPQGRYYIRFFYGRAVEVTQTIRVVSPALAAPLPTAELYLVNMTRC